MVAPTQQSDKIMHAPTDYDCTRATIQTVSSTGTTKVLLNEIQFRHSSTCSSGPENTGLQNGARPKLE